MPYILTKDRDRFDQAVAEFPTPASAGELNYVISRLCHQYIRHHGKRYAVFNEVVGVLECAKSELYRRIISPYEDGKILANGDLIL